MIQRKGITCCCTTDHGGLVLEGYALAKHRGHRVAGLGHRVYCPKCDGIFPIVESTKSFAGYAPATEGMRTACGARLIPMFDDLWVDDDSGLADLGPPKTDGGHAEQATPSPHASSAGLSTPAFEAARDANKVHVNLRIGIGSDGTGNNFSNGEKALLLCSPEALKLEPKLDPDMLDALKRECRSGHGMEGASYDSGETNVHRLFNLYKVTDTVGEAVRGSDGRLYAYLRVYMPGIGTESGRPDDARGSGLGDGATGVIARAKAAIHSVITRIQEFYRNNPDIIIDSIEFDLWGFSRGAAASRHLSWLILHGGDESFMARALREASPLNLIANAGGSGLGGAWAATSPTGGTDPSAMQDALNNASLPLKPGFAKQDLKIQFIGLFDTVAALGIPDNANNDPVHLYLPSSGIGKVVHLAARDECRLNFASNPVGSYVTIRLPGVHSDIGGGYLMLVRENLILGQPETSVERYTDKQAPLINGRPLPPSPTESQAWRRAFTQMLDYQWSDYTLLDRSSGADEDHSKLWIQSWPGECTTQVNAWGKPSWRQIITSAVRLKRQVRGEYQLVTLRIMYELAKEAGVPFGKSPDDVPELTLPTELAPIYRKLLAYARAGGRGKNGLIPDEECLLSRRYLHQSAHWNPLGWSPPIRPTDRDVAPQAVNPLLFLMRPAPDRKRNVFDPLPGH